MQEPQQQVQKKHETATSTIARGKNGENVKISEISEKPKNVFGRWHHHGHAPRGHLTEEEKQAWRDSRWTPDQQAIWAAMTHEERHAHKQARRAERHAQRMARMTPEQRERQNRWLSMTPEERAKIKQERREQFRQMAPEEQAQSKARWAHGRPFHRGPPGPPMHVVQMNGWH